MHRMGFWFHLIELLGPRARLPSCISLMSLVWLRLLGFESWVVISWLKIELPFLCTRIQI